MPILLSNIFLLFGLVALIPLVLHLFHRRRPQPVLFAAVRFLQEAVAKSRRSHRITQCITLLMRVLIILLLAFAFSRPVMKFSRFVPGNHRTLLLVVDCSASMQAQESGRSLFEASLLWIGSLLDTLEEGDKVAVLASGLREPRIVFPPVSDLPGVKAAVNELKPGFGGNAMFASLLNLLNKDAAPLQGAEVHVFSDFQNSAESSEILESLAKKLRELNCALFYNRGGVVTSGDAAICNAKFVPPAVMPGSSFSVQAKVYANGQFAGTASLGAEDNGAEKGRTSLELMPGEMNEAKLELNPTQDEKLSSVAGRLFLEEDAYSPNNIFYYSLPRIKGVRVQIVYGSSPRDAVFLKHAVNPGGRNVSLVNVTEADWSSFLSSGAEDSALVFICNPPEFGETALAKIGNLLSGGATVVLFPGNGGGVSEAVLRHFEAFKSIKCRKVTYPAVRNVSVAISGSGELPSQLRRTLPPPWNVPLRSQLDLDCALMPDLMLLECDGRAFAAQGQEKGGNLMVFSVTSNRDWSDWPVAPSFLVCMQEICRTAAAKSEIALTARAGHPLAVPWAGQELHKDFEVKSPAGNSIRVTVDRKSPAQNFIIDCFDEPGIYSIASENKEVQVAVNIPEDEARLDYMESQQVLALLPEVQAAFCKDNAELQRQCLELRQGSPLWPALLVIAFFLSMAEVIFANIRSRSIETPKLISSLK